MSETVGYARVSTRGQDTQLQRIALGRAGCDRVVCETGSGARRDRPVLCELVDTLSAGDVIVVWKLDRLSRSLRDLLELLHTLEDRGIGFQCVTQPVDTTTAAGKMMLAMLGAVAEFERSMILERITAGIEKAKSEGRPAGGRPSALTYRQRAFCFDALRTGSHTQADLSRLFSVSRTTITRLVHRGQP